MIKAAASRALRGGALTFVFALAVSPGWAAPHKGGRAERPTKSEPKVEAKRKVEPEPSAAAPAGVTYALKDLIKAKSGEFCAPYGADGNCIQEVEICLSMVDRDGDPVRLCVNTAPEEGRDAQARTARFRP